MVYEGWEGNCLKFVRDSETLRGNVPTHMGRMMLPRALTSASALVVVGMDTHALHGSVYASGYDSKVYMQLYIKGNLILN